MRDLLGESFPRDELQALVAEAARQEFYIGTSSWKYEGWLGLLYTPERYRTRGKLSRTKFDRTCIAEYAEVFPTVCLDGGFYQFPTPGMLDTIFSQVPETFRLSLKVTEDITVRQFPQLPRYGLRAGQTNPHFLDADLFIASFLGPLAPYRARVGTLFLEFSHLHPGDGLRGRDFVQELDGFLARLPRDWDYSVEVRNENLLQPEYFEMLRRHRVAHTFNSWTKMPPVPEQVSLPGAFTADFASARFLLKPGRSYEQAVEKFQPYTEVREEYLPARAALRDLLTPKPGRPKRRFIYVNNRLEGCSLWTIYAALSGLLKQSEADRILR